METSRAAEIAERGEILKVMERHQHVNTINQIVLLLSMGIFIVGRINRRKSKALPLTDGDK